MTHLHTMRLLVVTVLSFIFKVSLVTLSLRLCVTCHVFSVTRMFTAPVSCPDWGGQWPGEAAPGCHAASAGAPASSPVSQSRYIFSSPGLRALTHRYHPGLLTALSSPVAVLPDNSKYVPMWWDYVSWDPSINNSFPRATHEYHKCTHWVIKGWY